MLSCTRSVIAAQVLQCRRRRRRRLAPPPVDDNVSTGAGMLFSQ